MSEANYYFYTGINVVNNPMKKAILFAFILFSLDLAHAQVFIQAKTALKGVMLPAVEWLDIPNSNRLGVLVNGDYFLNDKHFVVSQTNKYKDANHFIYIKNRFPSLYNGASASGDFNGDGNQDIVMTGLTEYNTPVMQLFINIGAYRYQKTNQLFVPLTDGSLVWGDFDADKDLDILATGKNANNELSTIIYRNDNGSLSETVSGIPGVYFGTADWGDFNGDGKLDVLITGDSGGKPFTAVYKLSNKKYKRLEQSFTPLKHSCGKWGDLDNDGDLDFIISGEDSYGYPVCKIYSNDSGYFKEIPVGIRGLKSCTIDLGDYDRDGDLDIVMTGESLERSYTLVYENLRGFTFRDIMAGLPGLASGTAKWGDYDGDGDLDLLMAGVTICYDFISRVYKNTLNPVIKKEVPESIFNEAVTPKINLGPYYYYVFSSCYCDPSGGSNKAYHMYISNIHKEYKKYNLTYKFNDLLLKEVPNWAKTDRGHRTSNGFETYKEAEISRNQIIDSYKSTKFFLHYLNW